MIDIAFVLTTLAVGGQERVVVDTVKGLDRTKYRPHIYCLKDRERLANEAESAGVDLASNFLSSKWDLRVIARLAYRMRHDHIQVVETVGVGDTMFWGIICGRLARAPVVVAALHSTRDPQGNPVISRLNRMLIPMVDKYIVLGDAHRDYFVTEEGLSAANTAIIYNGVDYSRFEVDPSARANVRNELGVAEETPVVGIVAVLRPEKAHWVLIQAAEQVLAKYPDCVFVIVGDGPERSHIESQIRDAGLVKSFRLLGLRSDIPSVLSALDIAVLCSDDRVETFSISILEYMSAARPVVSTRVGSVEELVKENETAFLVPPRSPDEFAEALMRLVGDRALARRMGEAGRARVEQRFAVRNMVQAREELYESLLSRSAGRKGS